METLKRLKQKLLWKVGGSIEVKCQFPFGNCIVKCLFTEKSTDIEVWNPTKDTYLDNVAEWLKGCIEQPAESSEWNDNGFRNEADYFGYRF